MTKMTIKEYAVFLGVEVPAIMYRMKNKKFLPGVKKYYTVAATKTSKVKVKYIFEVDDKMKSSEARKYLQSKVA